MAYAGYRSSPHGPQPTSTSVMVVPSLGAKTARGRRTSSRGSNSRACAEARGMWRRSPRTWAWARGRPRGRGTRRIWSPRGRRITIPRDRAPPPRGPSGEGNVVVVVPVGAAGVKREDGVELQPHALDQTHEFDVRRPIVLAGSVALHDAPPDVHHDALDARALKRAETVRQLLHALKLALARDGIQREHDVHGDAPSRARRGGGGRLVTAGFPARPDYSGRIVPERHYYTAPIGGGGSRPTGCTYRPVGSEPARARRFRLPQKRQTRRLGCLFTTASPRRASASALPYQR